MNSNPTIEIALSKSKLTKFLIFSILFLAAGGWMLSAEPLSGNYLLGNPVVKNLVATLAIAMGTLGIIFFIKKLNDKRPGFVINEDGINDNSSAVAFGKIHWRDISHIQTTGIMNQQFIVIGLKNPQEYIDRYTQSMRRKSMQWNVKQYGSPVIISTSSLKCNRDELRQLLESKLAAYRSARA
jgi:hypothetical protein